MRPMMPGEIKMTMAAMTSSATMLFLTNASPVGELRDDASTVPRGIAELCLEFNGQCHYHSCL
jgi:hypothetical protein